MHHALTTTTNREPVFYYSHSLRIRGGWWLPTRRVSLIARASDHYHRLCHILPFAVTSICSPCPRYVEDGTNGMRALERTHISDGTHYLWPYSTILFGRLCWFSYPSSSSSRLTFFVVFPLVAFFTHTLSPGFLRSLPLVGLKGVLELPLYVPFCFVPCFAASTIGDWRNNRWSVEVRLFCLLLLRNRREASNSNFRCITRASATKLPNSGNRKKRTNQPMLHRFRRQKHKR